jgi:glyoxylase-like metal-dependent hydrolase (beta-lactamase superfamily II)
VLQTNDAPSTIYAFAPNRETLGGTAYFIVEEENILVDCPAWSEATQQFLQAQGGVRWLFLTHRGGRGDVRAFQAAFGCEVVVQEQEAYLLPNLRLTRFEQAIDLTPHTRARWTPGHSPGSACLYHSGFGGVLFSGRHLLPTPQAELRPLRTSKTFHWRRQLQSVQRLRDEFCPDTLTWICPGAHTGFLRGQRLVDQAYDRLLEIDLAIG